VVCDIYVDFIDSFCSLPYPDSKVKCKNILHRRKTSKENCIGRKLALVEYRGSASAGGKKEKGLGVCAFTQNNSKTG